MLSIIPFKPESSCCQEHKIFLMFLAKPCSWVIECNRWTFATGSFSDRIHYGWTAEPTAKVGGFLLSCPLSAMCGGPSCGEISGLGEVAAGAERRGGGPALESGSSGLWGAVRVEGGVRGVMALGPIVDRDQVEAERGAVAEAVIAVADSGRLWRGAALSSEQRERA